MGARKAWVFGGLLAAGLIPECQKIESVDMDVNLFKLDSKLCAEVLKGGDRICIKKRQFSVVNAWFNVYAVDLPHGARPGDPVLKGPCPEPGFDILINGAIQRTHAPIPRHVRLPFHVVVDEDRLYCVDKESHRVSKFSIYDNMHQQQGFIVAGAFKATASEAAGTSPKHLRSPTFVLLLSSRELLVADTGNHRVQLWVAGSPQGGKTVAGQEDGTAGATLADLDSPRALAVVRTAAPKFYERLFVADWGNHRVLAFPPRTPGRRGVPEGIHVAAVSAPAGLYFRRAALYVVETENNTAGTEESRLVMYTAGTYAQASHRRCAGHVADSRAGSLEDAIAACSTASNCTRFDFAPASSADNATSSAYRLRTDESEKVDCEEWGPYEWEPSTSLSGPVVLATNLSRPHAVTFDEQLGLLVTDTSHGQIRRIRPGSVQVETLVSGLRAPTSVSARGDVLYIADAGSRQVFQWPLSSCAGDLTQCWHS